MGTDPDEVKFDLELTRRNFDHDEALVREIGVIFIEDVPQLVDQLTCLRDQLLSSQADEQNVQQGAIALREAKRLAHSIKGLAATFGAEPLVSLAREIEEELACMSEEHIAAKVQRLAEVALDTVDHLALKLRLPTDDLG
jgi:chemotaxis protein histidine kinase CheA